MGGRRTPRARAKPVCGGELLKGYGVREGPLTVVVSERGARSSSRFEEQQGHRRNDSSSPMTRGRNQLYFRDRPQDWPGQPDGKIGDEGISVDRRGHCGREGKGSGVSGRLVLSRRERPVLLAAWQGHHYPDVRRWGPTTFRAKALFRGYRRKASSNPIRITLAKTDRRTEEARPSSRRCRDRYQEKLWRSSSRPRLGARKGLSLRGRPKGR